MCHPRAFFAFLAEDPGAACSDLVALDCRDKPGTDGEEAGSGMTSDSIHIAFVVAIADNGVIGRDNGLPWKLSGDMAHFKRLTMGKPIVMGRKTWESLPKKPLPGRPNIVVTRDPAYRAEGADLAGSADEALALARRRAVEAGVDEIMVIGGAQLYYEMLDHADRLYITEVHAAPQGDVAFPAFDPEKWREVSRALHRAGDRDSADYSFVMWQRA